MNIQPTDFEGVFEITPVIHKDNRGYFLETYKEEALIQAGLATNFVQDNQSYSSKNVIRGLHLQVSPHEQVKLVRVISGKVLDVIVDLRRDSQTFGQHYKCLLEAEKGNMLYIPSGFAHGITVLEDAIFSYKCSDYYNKESETGIIYNDPDLDIDWQVENPKLSEKDNRLMTFKEFIKIYEFA